MNTKRKIKQRIPKAPKPSKKNRREKHNSHKLKKTRRSNKPKKEGKPPIEQMPPEGPAAVERNARGGKNHTLART